MHEVIENTPILEVCVDNADSLNACIKGPVDRIELCSALNVGGLTPGKGMMQLAATTHKPVYAMIRPRSGDFCFSKTEVKIICSDIDCAIETGLAGVVLGAATPDGRLDTAALQAMAKTAAPLKKTLHRVIDTLDDPIVALDQAIDLGFDHVLTSGGTCNVEHGIKLLAKLHAAASGRINIIAGAGLTPLLVPRVAGTGVRAFHSSCRKPLPVDDRLVSLGFGSALESVADPALMQEFRDVINAIDH